MQRETARGWNSGKGWPITRSDRGLDPSEELHAHPSQPQTPRHCISDNLFPPFVPWMFGGRNVDFAARTTF